MLGQYNWTRGRVCEEICNQISLQGRSAETQCSVLFVLHAHDTCELWLSTRNQPNWNKFLLSILTSFPSRFRSQAEAFPTPKVNTVTRSHRQCRACVILLNKTKDHSSNGARHWFCFFVVHLDGPLNETWPLRKYKRQWARTCILRADTSRPTCVSLSWLEGVGESVCTMGVGMRICRK